MHYFVVLVLRSLYNFALVGRLILTWFPTRPAALERPLRYGDYLVILCYFVFVLVRFVIRT